MYNSVENIRIINNDIKMPYGIRNTSFQNLQKKIISDFTNKQCRSLLFICSQIAKVIRHSEINIFN